MCVTDDDMASQYPSPSVQKSCIYALAILLLATQGLYSSYTKAASERIDCSCGLPGSISAGVKRVMYIGHH